MINKNFEKMLLFVTLCILLLGIVTAESVDSDNLTPQTDIISDQTSNTENCVSEVNDEIVNDNIKIDYKDNLKKNNITEKNVKNYGKTNTKITIDPIEKKVYVGSSVAITGELTDIDDNPITYAPVRIEEGSDVYNIQTNQYGWFVFSHRVTTPGSYAVTASYGGNSFYNSSSAHDFFYVIEKTYTDLSLNGINNVTIGDNVTIRGYFRANYGLKSPVDIAITINGQTYWTQTDTNGNFKYNYKTNVIGKNNVTAFYMGNYQYQNASTTEHFNVNRIYTYINLNDINEVYTGQYATISGYYYYSGEIPLTLTTMRININGQTYTAKTDNNGYFTYNYKTTKSGFNTVTVSYPGNTKFGAAKSSQTFNVKSTGPQYTYITLNNIQVVAYGEYTTITGHYYYGNNIPLTLTTMRLNINGKTYTAKTDKQGYFTYAYKTNRIGKNTVTVTYPGNTNFKAATSTKTFDVKITSPIYTYITLNNIKEVNNGQYTTISGHYYYGDNIPLTQTNMRIKINGQTYTAKTDNNGYFTYNYKTTKAGSNTVTVSYPGNTNFKSATASKTFNVKSTGPQSTYVKLYNIYDAEYGSYAYIDGYYYYGNNIPLTYTPMSININGEKYTAKTDNEGYFYYYYKITKVGKKTVNVSYHGNTNFKAASTVKTFNVKITNPIYTYVDLYDVKDVKLGEYTTIRGYYYYGNGEPLTLTTMRININGQTYTAKTDNSGYFKYDYKTTKSGTNTVTVTYPGNTNFKAASDSDTFNVNDTNNKMITLYTYFTDEAPEETYIGTDAFTSYFETRNNRQNSPGVWVDIRSTRGTGAYEYPPTNRIISATFYFMNDYTAQIKTKTVTSTRLDYISTSLIPDYTPYKVDLTYRKMTAQETNSWWN